MTLTDPVPQPIAPLARRHFRNGWMGLSLFAVLGIALEGLHAWKSSAYLGVGNETRRLMWTLAHAHGVGLSLLQLGYAATLALAFERVEPRLKLASRLLNWAFILIPAGFLLGGVGPYEADPGLGVLLVPIRALLLVIGLACVAFALWK